MAGRPKTTGRFRTRAELVDRVRSLYFSPDFDLSVSGVARHCRVSEGVAHSIIDSREWDTLEPHDDGATGVLRHDQEPFDVDVHLDPMTHSACGSGYDFALYPLHIPDRIKRDLDLM